jgi:hypothetical protein
MREDGTRKLILGGLFVALGIVLPMAFHSVGAGPVFFLCIFQFCSQDA